MHDLATPTTLLATLAPRSWCRPRSRTIAAGDSATNPDFLGGTLRHIGQGQIDARFQIGAAGRAT